jgi:hypothetical protein
MPVVIDRARTLVEAKSESDYAAGKGSGDDANGRNSE